MADDARGRAVSSPHVVDDAALLTRIANGDEDAFADLFRKYARLVFAHAARLMGDATDAEDVTAVVFLEAWRKRKDIRLVNGRAAAWLLVTTTNVTLNQRRGHRRYRNLLARIPAPRHHPDHGDETADRLDAAPAARVLAQALDRLSDLDRQIVSLCLVGELTYAEAAEALGTSHATVRNRLSRSRKALREALSAAGIVAGGDDDE